jgi:hypothetical protein
MLVDQHRMGEGDVTVQLVFKLIQRIIDLVFVRMKSSVKSICYVLFDLDVNECEIWDECDQDCQNTIGS